MGGYISDNYHWGWIFLINVPVGIVDRASLSWRFLASRETPTRKLPIDTVGLALLAFWVFSLQTVLDLGKDRDWFHNPMIAVLAIVRRDRLRRLDDLGADRRAAGRRPHRCSSAATSRFGVIALCLGYALFFANNLLLPLWLQEQMGYTATWAGFVAAPSGIVAVIATPFVGRFKIDARWLATRRFLAFAASYFMRSHYTPDASFWALIAPLLLQGLAMSMFFVPLLDHPAGRHPAREAAVGERHLQLRAHHRGQLRRLADHHLLGSPRGAAPVPAGRSRDRLFAGLSAGDRPAPGATA